MRILRQKEFGLFSRHNKDLADWLCKNLNTTRPDKGNYEIELPEDLLRYFTICNKFSVKDKIYTSYDTQRGTSVNLCGKENILKQLRTGKEPTSIRHAEEERAVIAITGGSEYFTISWFVNSTDRVFKVTHETAPLALISRGVNRLFGKKNFEIKYETDSLQDAFKWIDSYVITIAY